MKKCVLDTNAFLRLFLNDIPAQANLVENLLKKAKNAEITIYLPQIIIFEIAYALDKYYKFPKEEVIQKLKSIIVSPYLKVQNREVFKETVRTYKNQTISLSDCFISQFAKYKDCELFTFDKKLKKLSKNS